MSLYSYITPNLIVAVVQYPVQARKLNRTTIRDYFGFGVGINGMQIYNDDIYICVSDRATIYKIDVD